MSPTASKPLVGWRVLVPASRAGQNVLSDLLAKRGAQVVVFPSVRGAPPSDPAAVQTAIARLDSVAWLIFSGELSVTYFCERLGDRPIPARVGAIGIGAVKALKARGIPVAYAPKAHVASAVVAGLGEVSGKQVMVIREEAAEDVLPDALRGYDAEVIEVAGYRALLDADLAQAHRALGTRPDLIALANPSAARILAGVVTELGLSLEKCFGGVPLASVGPATAEAAARYGFESDLISGGRLAQLVKDLMVLLGRGHT